MPIHTDWKSMAESMSKESKYKAGKIKCRDFTDGSKVCMSSKAWSVFFATINKMGADDTKPRPATINETVFNETVTQVLNELVEWAVKRE
jgi:hypothetical protein